MRITAAKLSAKKRWGRKIKKKEEKYAYDLSWDVYIIIFFRYYQQLNKGARELMLCLKWKSLSSLSRWYELVDVWCCMIWCWWPAPLVVAGVAPPPVAEAVDDDEGCRSCLSLVNSTVMHGIWTSCSGVLLSLSACTRFKIWPRITDICFSNVLLSKPRSFWKKKKTKRKFIRFYLKALFFHF